MQGSLADLASSQGSSILNEKTEFDERLGQMNKRYQACSSDVLERLKNLEMLEIRWQEFEKMYNNFVNWFSDQQGKVDKYGKLGHEASMQQMIKDCQVCVIGSSASFSIIQSSPTVIPFSVTLILL
jgi:hypothetical protein